MRSAHHTLFPSVKMLKAVWIGVGTIQPVAHTFDSTQKLTAKRTLNSATDSHSSDAICYFGLTQIFFQTIFKFSNAIYFRKESPRLVKNLDGRDEKSQISKNNHFKNLLFRQRRLCLENLPQNHQRPKKSPKKMRRQNLKFDARQLFFRLMLKISSAEARTYTARPTVRVKQAPGHTIESWRTGLKQ